MQSHRNSKAIDSGRRLENCMIDIRLARETDEEGIRALFRDCFGKELSHDEWRWKYVRSPWGSSAVIALDEDSVVAHYGGLKMMFHSPSRTFDVYQPCDVMTHPKYRARFFTKKGAMIKAGELFYLANQMDFAYGFPSERHAVLGTKQLGYTVHDYVTVLRKKVSGTGHIQNHLFKINTGWDSIQETELDALWGKVRDSYGLTIDKIGRYIFWRYRDNPVRKYKPIMLRGLLKRDLRAFAVFSVQENELSVLDFFSSTTREMNILFQLLEKIAAEQGLSNLKLWMNDSEERFRVLSDKGCQREQGIPYIFKIIDEELTPAFLFKQYWYRQGDYDAS